LQYASNLFKILPGPRDLKDSRGIGAKALLFLLIGVTASALLLIEMGTLKGALLLTLSVWGFCRTYYFAFYVVEKYVDPDFRFPGLIAFARYWLRRK
jgi:hypothetical protein